ncbi:MAG: EpsG family protein [Saccharofermentans sp.]|nr:EpsG family protein [Saccharofermentans sp.]
MSFYIIIFVLTFIGLFVSESSQFKSAKRKRIVFYILFIILTFFACFRDKSVGTDTQYYIRLYQSIANIEWADILEFSLQSGYEIGYVIYNRILASFVADSNIITITNSLIVMVLAGRLIRKECINPVLGVFCFFTIGLYQSSFNIVSSMIAALFVLNGIDYIRNRNIIKFIICVFLGCLFHSATILLIIPYIVYRFRITGKILLFSFAISALASLAFPIMIDVFSRMIPSKYIIYLSRGSDNGMILLFHSFIIIAVLIAYIATYHKVFHLNDDDIRIHTWMVVLEIAFLLLSLRNNIFTRAAYFFMPCLPIFIDKAVSKLESRNNRLLVYSVLVFAIGVQYIIRIHINNIGGSIPYVFSFEFF